MIKLHLTKYEKRNYIIKDKKDYIILSLIRKIEKFLLTNKDKEIIRLIRTQLKKDWRAPLINYLKKLFKRYKK